MGAIYLWLYISAPQIFRNIVSKPLTKFNGGTFQKSSGSDIPKDSLKQDGLMDSLGNEVSYPWEGELCTNLLQINKAQIKYPLKNCWNNKVKSALGQLEIKLSYEMIKNIKTKEFKKRVKKESWNCGILKFGCQTETRI